MIGGASGRSLDGGWDSLLVRRVRFSLRPDVWRLDEPTASLDPRRTSRLLDFIEALGKSGNTVITATHDLNIVEEIADRVIMFREDHEIVGDSTPRAVLSNYDQLLACNLIHEHRHRHAQTEHVHYHLHASHHEHEHERKE